MTTNIQINSWATTLMASFLYLGISPIAMASSLDLKMPLEPGSYRVTRGIASTGYHSDSYAIDFATSVNGRNVLAALSGEISSVVRNVCDDQNRDVCTNCDPTLAKFTGAAVLRTPDHENWSELGNHIVISHDGNYKTVYGHLRCGSIPSEIIACSALPQSEQHRCRIKQGALLGKIGTSGYSDGNHLHFEVRYNNSPKLVVPELANVTIQGLPMANYVRTNKEEYISLNRPGIEFTAIGISGIAQVITSQNPLQATVTYTVTNNSNEPLQIKKIEIFGVPQTMDSAEQIAPIETLDSFQINTTLNPGSQITESRPITLRMPPEKVGIFRIGTNYTDLLDKKHTGNLTKNLIFVVDQHSRLVDDSSSEFKISTPLNVYSHPTAGINGGNATFVYSNSSGIFGSWIPENITPGFYEVLVYIPSEISKVPSINYEIFSSDPAKDLSMIHTSIPVSQLNYPGQWVSLGRFLFTNTHKEILLSSIGFGSPYKVGYDAVLFKFSATLDDFDDLDAQSWFYESTQALQRSGVLSGGRGTNFRPTDPATRAEFLKMAMAAARHEGRSFYIDIAELPPFIGINLLFSLLGEPYPPFSDVSNSDWYFNEVTLGYIFGIVNGRTDGTFGPTEFITRAEAMKIIVKAFDFDLSDGADQIVTFRDIDLNDWYIPYLQTLHKHQIISGYQDGTIHPHSTISRAEAAAIIKKTLDNAKKIERN